jgi:hypothetical protein
VEITIAGGNKYFRHKFVVKKNTPVLKPSQKIFIDDTLETHIQQFDKIYDDNKIYQNIQFKYFYHPFIKLKNEVKTVSTPHALKITNAFKKLYEILHYLYTDKREIKMFDIASAPCMFIVCAEYFFKKVDYNINSLGFDKGHALGDQYGIIAANFERFQEGDVCLKEDRDKLEGKYELITGDIGDGIRDYTSQHLQEYSCLKMQFGQFIIAMKLSDKGANIVLKMYSLITYNSIYILDLASNYFERVEVVKPYTSKFFNFECYVIGINRNSIAFVEPEFLVDKSFDSPNIEIVEEYERMRIDEKLKLGELYKKIYKSDWTKNEEYCDYIFEMKDIYDKIKKISL